MTVEKRGRIGAVSQELAKSRQVTDIRDQKKGPCFSMFYAAITHSEPVAGFDLLKKKSICGGRSKKGDNRPESLCRPIWRCRVPLTAASKSGVVIRIAFSGKIARQFFRNQRAIHASTFLFLSTYRLSAPFLLVFFRTMLFAALFASLVIAAASDTPGRRRVMR